MKKRAANLDQSERYDALAPMRPDIYILLAALLAGQPGLELIDLIKRLQWDDTVPAGMQRQLAALNRACSNCTVAVIADEFHRLFVGLGSGELVPYSSWYREKTIQSTPLAAIRDDLLRLGIVRQADSHESEDHAGALCEIMALISDQENDVPLAMQAHFFDKHIAPWMGVFFRDLQEVQDVKFYRVVGALGSSFIAAESEYLQESLNCHDDLNQGGMQDDSKIF